MSNIENLTIKEAKQKLAECEELAILFNLQEMPNKNKSKLFDRYIGKYVICRSRNEGINAGYVVDLDETGVILKQARRLFTHRPANRSVSWYEGVAVFGISEDSKVAPPSEKIIIENYSLTVCSKEAESSIKNAKNNEQS